MHTQTHHPRYISWLPVVWVLVGVELLAALYFALLGPADIAPDPEFDLVRTQILLDLARATALVNLLVLMGLWLRVRTRPLGDGRALSRRIGGLLVAASLLLAPLAFFLLAQKAAEATVQIEKVWERPEGAD